MPEYLATLCHTIAGALTDAQQCFAEIDAGGFTGLRIVPACDGQRPP